ncbi:MAG: Crp/Fnr family transcriptional regulator [Crocinitomicaceae bacterium]|nr:Crp/Fnr family transcriptional regulator [Crocinitomicaceae bacterium]
MTNKENLENEIRDRLGFLFEEELLKEIVKVGNVREISIDNLIVDVGDTITEMPFILDGSVKVSRENAEGEELLLYYIESGDTCAMTLQCCVRRSNSEIKATTMEDSRILMIPVNYMEDWMDRYASWRRYILESYHTRMTELMETIDAIAFMRLDERLDRYLIDQAKIMGSLEIKHTHQQIAEDLHSSRVVISRLLKQMESKGKIKLHRNRIVLSSI